MDNGENRDLLIKVYKIKDLDFYEENKVVNEVNYQMVKAKLEIDYNQIVNEFKKLKEQGLINSIYIPKNKKLQKEINTLITVKKDIKNSISKINSLF